MSDGREPGRGDTADRDDDLPPIIDPYLSEVAWGDGKPGAPAGSPGSAGPSGGGLPPWAVRPGDGTASPAPPPRTGKAWGLATVLILVAGVMTLFAGAAGAVTAYRLLADPGDERLARAADHDADDEDDEDEDEEENDDVDDRSPPRDDDDDDDDDDPQGKVPRDNVEKKVGDIVVVDVGYGAASLEEALRTEREAARASNQRMLVMTVRELCEPCDGVDASLAHPLMQQALKGIRLVRVDADVFRNDIQAIGMFPSPYPGYFLFGPDFTLRDAIDGGEWGPDIAENIAPVLGPFVRGEYNNRKTRYGPSSGGGIAL